MTQPHNGVRGPGRSRGGATDTIMLIWKIIEANPGIDRAGIWERAEHGIPEGYALRRYANSLPRDGKRTADISSVQSLARARNYVLGHTLTHMRHSRPPMVGWEGLGNDRRYTALRLPHYVGDPGTVDETGTKAAEHMARADALRILKAARARVNPAIARGPNLTIRRGREMEAFDLMLEALSNTPSAN